MHEEVKTMCFHEKIVKLTHFLLSGWDGIKIWHFSLDVVNALPRL